MAAAVTLASNDISVEVFEAGKQLGGRARCIEYNGVQLDNGQHILIGAYSETLRLIRKVSACRLARRKVQRRLGCRERRYSTARFPSATARHRRSGSMMHQNREASGLD